MLHAHVLSKLTLRKMFYFRKFDWLTVESAIRYPSNYRLKTLNTEPKENNVALLNRGKSLLPRPAQ